MEAWNALSNYIIPFLGLLAVLVFIHEMGHYLVARWNGVRVESFSVGFGPELFGFTDRRGTRWRLSVIPLGGYVSLFGMSEGSTAPEDRSVSFTHKTVGQRAAIIAAGPAANFLLAIVALTLVFSVHGQPHNPAIVGAVSPGSAAEKAGMLPGDQVVMIEGRPVAQFRDVLSVLLEKGQSTLSLQVKRGEDIVDMTVTPGTIERAGPDGSVVRAGYLGVTRVETEYRRLGIFDSIWQATVETYRISADTLSNVGKMITGKIGTEGVAGPIGIAKATGDAAQSGFVSMVLLGVLLSVNLGLLNLFPVPLLDGGHLMFYAIEAVRGRSLGPRAMGVGAMIGLTMVLLLMVLGFSNDISRLWN